MKLKHLLIFAIALCGLFLWARPAASQSGNSSKLEVHLKYSGSGSVDAQHKIYAVLWDTPNFADGANTIPVDIQSLSSKEGTVTFSGLQKSPVYVSTVYDVTGSWDAQSAPPNGCSLGLYSKTPGRPEPVELKSGKTNTIDVTFDDRIKMQDGKAVGGGH